MLVYLEKYLKWGEFIIYYRRVYTFVQKANDKYKSHRASEPLEGPV